MAQRLLHLIDISDEWKRRIVAIVPNVEFLPGSRNEPQFPEQLRLADIVLGSVKIHDRAEAPNLEWIQLPHAGADGWQETPEGILISTGAGVYGVPIAEHLLALMLGLTRGIHTAVRAMPHAQWKQPGHHLELCGATALVVGFGDIGQQFAKRAHAFGMRVIAVKRTLSEPPDYIERIVTTDHLDDVLPEADHVVISLPGTAHTRHLFSAGASRS